MLGHLERVAFVNLLRHAGVLVGNSSAGILESAFLGLPVINVGRRQLGREHGSNVIFVDHDRLEIKAELMRALHDETRIAQAKDSVNPYGDGFAAKASLDFLRSIEESGRDLLLKKQG